MQFQSSFSVSQRHFQVPSRPLRTHLHSFKLDHPWKSISLVQFKSVLFRIAEYSATCKYAVERQVSSCQPLNYRNTSNAQSLLTRFTSPRERSAADQQRWYTLEDGFRASTRISGHLRHPTHPRGDILVHVIHDSAEKAIDPPASSCSLVLPFSRSRYLPRPRSSA